MGASFDSLTFKACDEQTMRNKFRKYQDDACEERGISLLGVYSQGEFKGAYEGTVEDLTSATSAVGVFIG
mgnify:CR=1 FL=1